MRSHRIPIGSCHGLFIINISLRRIVVTLLLVGSLLLYLKYTMQYLFHNIQEILYINVRNRINILKSLALIVYVRILFTKPKKLDTNR